MLLFRSTESAVAEQGYIQLGVWEYAGLGYMPELYAKYNCDILRKDVRMNIL